VVVIPQGCFRYRGTNAVMGSIDLGNTAVMSSMFADFVL